MTSLSWKGGEDNGFDIYSDVNYVLVGLGFMTVQSCFATSKVKEMWKCKKNVCGNFCLNTCGIILIDQRFVFAMIAVWKKYIHNHIGQIWRLGREKVNTKK